MEPEMVSISVDNAPAFLQLRDKYKQELVEDTRLTKAADLAAKQHVLLASDAPMPGNDLNSKPWGVNYAIGPKKSANRLGPRPVACAPRVPRPLATMILRQGPCKRGSRNMVKATQGLKQGTTPGGRSKPPVPPKPNSPLMPKRNSSSRPK